MLLATSAYVICIIGIISMYIWYAPQPSCLLNVIFITWTLVLLQLMTSLSLHPRVSFEYLTHFYTVHSCILYNFIMFWLKQVNAGFLTPGFMGLYVVFLCWSAVRRHGLISYCGTLMNCILRSNLWSNSSLNIIFCDFQWTTRGKMYEESRSCN